MICQNILETIGKTPLVRINKLVSKHDAELVAKVESFNPGGSVKDRIGLSMIEDAEMRGELKPSGTIIEPTSGNTGIGLAMVAAVKGYKVILVMPESMSIERRALLKHLGAKIVLTPADQGMTASIETARKLAQENGYFLPLQFQNPANPEVHTRTTALEIINDLKERELHYFVAGVGTGGTISGTGIALKKHFPDLKVVAVEPHDSPVLSGGKPGPHKIQGMGAGFLPEVYNADIVDEIISIKNEDAFSTAKCLAQTEGILCGVSSGASVFAAMQVAREAGTGKLVVVVIPDTGERYISTDLFKEDT